MRINYGCKKIVMAATDIADSSVFDKSKQLPRFQNSFLHHPSLIFAGEARDDQTELHSKGRLKALDEN
jgi:hypothetical protein